MAHQQVQCRICCNASTATLPFFCPTCARNSLYEPRIHNAQVLLSKEALSEQVEQVLVDTPEGACSTRNTANEHDLVMTAVALRKCIARKEELQERERHALDQVAHVHKNIEELKLDIVTMRHVLSERRAELRIARRELEKCESDGLDSLKYKAKQIDATSTVVRTRTADVRVFLSKELASLYGLLLRKRGKDPGTHDQYLLGQVAIVDLRDLNGTSPSQITVSAGRVAHFVYLVSHYLSVRLPGEIILPSSLCPHASIIPPISSYKDKPTQTVGRSNDTSTGTIRPRVLYIDKPLPALASDDPVAYAAFVEAITILAWNIAWLARTQGVSIGSTHWEEICAIGPNLQSLFGRASRSSTEKSALPRDATSGSPSDRQYSEEQGARIPKDHTSIGGQRDSTTLVPGHLSHNSSRAFICASTAVGGGGELMRSWHYASPYKLIERIKSALASERMGAEWELLDKDEWEDQATSSDQI